MSFVEGKGVGFLEIVALRQGPALLSNKSAKRLGLVLDTTNDRAYSRMLEAEIPFWTTGQGHYMLDLLGSGKALPGNPPIPCQLNVGLKEVAVSYTHLTLPTTPYV